MMECFEALQRTKGAGIQLENHLITQMWTALATGRHHDAEALVYQIHEANMFGPSWKRACRKGNRVFVLMRCMHGL